MSDRPDPSAPPGRDAAPARAASPPGHRAAIDELALVVIGDQDLGEVLHRVVRLAVSAVSAVGGVDEASITLYSNGVARTASFTGPAAAALDERQYESGFGPCLRCARTGEVVAVPSTDEGAAGEFEDFARQARREGVRSATCLPLAVPGRVVGALNTYGRGPRPLEGEGLVLAETFTAVAATVVASAVNFAAVSEQAANLRSAMQSRSVIEQAKGVLVARLHVDEEAAFEVLRRRSQHSNRKVQDIAAQIVGAAAAGDVEP